MESKILTDPNYLLRSIIENNPSDVLKKLDSYGYKGSEDTEDLIASVKYMFKSGDKAKGLDCLNVEIIAKNINSSLRKELEYVAKLKSKKLN